MQAPSRSQRSNTRNLLIALLVTIIGFAGVTISNASAQDGVTPQDETADNATDPSTESGTQVADPWIINGDPTRIRDVPYMVQIENGAGEHVCGGTLYSAKVVLTATHCLVRDNGNQQPGVANYVVRYGSTTQYGGDVVGFTNYYTAGTDNSKRQNDVAVIVLDNPVPLSNQVAPVQLATDAEIARNIGVAVALGWGKTSDTSGPSDNLLYAPIDVKSDAACRSVYNDQLYKADRHFCGGGDTTNVCFGDSGGPLMILVNGVWKQAGMTAAIYNQSCLSGNPSRFSDISYFREFIKGFDDTTTPPPTPGPTTDPTPPPTRRGKCQGETATVILALGETPTEGDDRILGTMDDDVINGLGGNDIICGRGGNDTISGGDGDDVLLGNDGNDLLLGGIGNDLLRGHRGDDIVIGGEGNDTIAGNLGNDTLRGDDGTDTINGFEGDDLIVGGEGDDILKGHAGKDQMTGGTGNDMLYGYKEDDSLFGGPGDDLLFGNEGNDTMYGGDGAGDVCRGAGGSDTAGADCEQSFSAKPA